MRTLLCLGSLPLWFGACTTSPATTFDNVDDALGTALVAAVGTATAGPVTLAYSGSCAGGGTVTVAGTFQAYTLDIDLYDDANSDLTFTFAGCSQGGPTLTGTIAVQIDGTENQTFAGTITGTISGGGVTSCALDVSVAIEYGLSTMFDGTVCGNAYDETDS